MSVTVPPTRPFAGFFFLPVRTPRSDASYSSSSGLCSLASAWRGPSKQALGASPWTVFHEGAADKTSLSFGTTVSLTGVLIVGALWLLKEPLGLGTLLNVAVIGTVADLTLWAVPDLESMWIRILMLLAAPVVIAFGSWALPRRWGRPGPRDGVMTAIHRRGVAT